MVTFAALTTTQPRMSRFASVAPAVLTVCPPTTASTPVGPVVEASGNPHRAGAAKHPTSGPVAVADGLGVADGATVGDGLLVAVGLADGAGVAAVTQSRPNPSARSVRTQL